MTKSRNKTIALVRQWLDENCLILDTETTGLDDQAEIVEITLIDTQGQVLLDTLVKPVCKIPADATAIHGITDQMVADAPSWDVLHSRFCQLISGRTLVIYNANYDIRLLDQTARLAGVGGDDFYPMLVRQSRCVMLAYAAYYGERRLYGGLKWQSLDNAGKQQNITVTGKAHRALVDCQMTLEVMKAMVGSCGSLSEEILRTDAG